MGLSCCIIAHNEGDRIERCILAVRGIVDEVVVVDCGSTDDTVAKAEALGAKVFYNAWDGYGPQKRFAEDCAANDWILNLDADEVVTPELAREIAALMRAPGGPVAGLPLPPGDRLSGPRQAAPMGRLPQLRAPLRPPARALPGEPRARHGRHRGLPGRAAQRRRAALLLALAGPRARQAREATRTCRQRSSRSRAGTCWRDCRLNIRSCSFAITSCGGIAPAACTGPAHCARDRPCALAAAAEDLRRRQREVAHLMADAWRHEVRSYGMSWPTPARGRVGRGQANARPAAPQRRNVLRRPIRRALRSGRIGKNCGHGHGRKGDGAGSQAQAVMSALCFAQGAGLPYIHRPFRPSSMPRPTCRRGCSTWEEYFNLGAFERKLGDDDGPPIVALDRLTASCRARSR